MTRKNTNSTKTCTNWRKYPTNWQNLVVKLVTFSRYPADSS